VNNPMASVKRIWRRLLFYLRRDRFDRELEEEMRFHQAMRAEENRGRGLSEGESKYAARRQFGNQTLLLEGSRDMWAFRWIEIVFQDLRFGARMMSKNKGFTAVATLTLALGVGANTAIFSVINAVLLRPLPYRDPGRLAMLWSENSRHGLQEGRVSLLNFADWKGRSRSFEDMTCFVGQTFLLGSVDGPPERMRSAKVSANFFPLLGVDPILGRVFSAEEEKRGESVVVLSYQLWQRQFGGSRNVVGSGLVMDGRKLRVIGVMPSSFQYPFSDTQVWELMTAHPYWAARDLASPRSSSIWYALGRIRSEVSWEQAQSEMSGVAHQLEAEYPENRDLPEIRVTPLYTQTTGSARLPLAMLFGSVSLLLLIACINVANLLLARGSARAREFAVRRALGASRGRLAGQLLTESLALSIGGGALGLALADASLKALITFGPREIPRLAESRIDSRVLLFTLALSLFAAVVCGLWPAMRNDTASAGSRQWTTVAARNGRDILLVIEFSIALILLAGAGLLARSLMRLQSVDPGFRPEKLLSMRIDLHVGKNAQQDVAYFREAIEHVKALPGVQSAAAISGFLRSDPEEAVEVEGRPPQQPGPCDDVIAGKFFETAGIPIMRGRGFTDQDGRDSPPVAIINTAMAQTYWPGEEPIGRRFRFPNRRSSQWITVVGLSGDMRRQGLEKQAAPQVFRPHAQSPDNMLDLIVRTSVAPQTVAAAVRSEIQSMDKSVARFDVTTVEGQLGGQLAERRFQASLIGLFALASLILSAIGIYGLMHYYVAQRTNEIGVRMALGARQGSVIALILRQGLKLAGAGVTFGIIGAFGFTRLLSRLLFETRSTDPLTFVTAPLILLGVAAIACLIPARRATKVDPMIALRHD
jgi:predicted permease